MNHTVIEMKKFLKAEVVEKIESGKACEATEKALYETDDWFNKTTITKDALSKISNDLKKAHEEIQITHVLDREFDNENYLNLIEKQGDKFVVRVKKSRNESEKEKTKLIHSRFENSHEIQIQKLFIKGKAYQDVTLLLEWKKYLGYEAVRISLRDRKQQALYKDPMVLLTNKEIKTKDGALLAYHTYLKRSKIESVFKFLKEGMGWESMQLRDFKAIQKLLSVCFFLAAYLYEIGSRETQDDFIILLSKLGGGKGIVSRHYLFKGIQALLLKHRIDYLLANEPPSKEALGRMEEVVIF